MHSKCARAIFAVAILIGGSSVAFAFNPQPEPPGKTPPTTQTTTPPDPCSKFTQRIAHERCVTRQMNTNGIHGGNTHANTSQGITGQGENAPYH